MDRMVHESGVTYYRSGRLAAMGVRHGFSTRLGGVSHGPFGTMNLGNPAGCPSPDPDSNLAANYHRFSVSVGLPPTRCWAFQVHGNSVLRVRINEPFENGRQADALISDDPHRCISIRAADCAAVLMASEGGQMIAAVHAGWRGVVADVVGAAARAMIDAGYPPVAGAVFPCISTENFEVGMEVVEAFQELDLPAHRIPETDKGRASVAESCAIQMVRSGVPRSSIELSGECTFDRESDFFSHRRDGLRTGRMALLAIPSVVPYPSP